MRHQRGYIYEAFNAFHVRYYVRELVDGQVVRKQKSHRLCTKDRAAGYGSASAKAVRELAEDFMREVNTDAPTTEALTVVKFWESIYQPFITANLKHSTVLGYEQLWNQHLKNHFGNTLLKDYKTPMGSMFLTALAKTYRPRTLQHIKFLSSGIFAHAVNTGHVECNPWRDCQVLGKTKEHGVTLVYSLEEIQAVLNALVDNVDLQLIMAFAFFLGLRKSEIQGLQWGDIEEDCLHVRRAVVRGVVGEPKSLKSRRTVPLIAPVKVLLTIWRNQAGAGEWVFSSGVGTPVDLKDVAQNRIRPALSRCGVTWKGFHAGRRGLGTTLRALTGNSNAGRDMLGHTTDQVTQDHYEAPMPEEVLKGMRLLEAKVSGNPS